MDEYIESLIKFARYLDPRRVMVIYNDEDRDGSIALRRGVPDLEMLGTQYAKVAIPVSDSYCIKGIAYYSEAVPKTYDVIVFTSKPRTVPLIPREEHANSIATRLTNADLFNTRRKVYTDENGNVQLSLVGVVSDTNDWGNPLEK